jgi:hypothetical protein
MQTEDLWIVPLDHAWAVRSDREGIVSEGHDCRASAQDFIDERRAAEDEARAADEAQQQADYMAECEMLDAIFREVSRRYDCDLPEAHPRNRAVKLALEALDGISKPIAADMAEAA